MPKLSLELESDVDVLEVLKYTQRVFREDAKIVRSLIARKRRNFSTEEDEQLAQDLKEAAAAIKKVLWYYTGGKA